MFSKAGEALTKRFREEAFMSYLRQVNGESSLLSVMNNFYINYICLKFQDIAFFDDPSHNTGAICSLLSTAATDIQGVTVLFRFLLSS